MPIDPRGQTSYAWQDPFAALPPERDFASAAVRETSARTSDLALREIVQRATANGIAPQSDVVPLSEVWVMLAESGPEPERVEDRRRHRVALHEAFALHKVLPLQSERILPVYHQWDPTTSFLQTDDQQELVETGSTDELPLVLEAFRGSFQGTPILITVAWVDELEVQGRTFRFADSLAASLKRAIAKTPGAPRILLGEQADRALRTVILGPSSSGKLRQLVKEPPSMRLRSPLRVVEALDQAQGKSVDFSDRVWRAEAELRIEAAMQEMSARWSATRLPMLPSRFLVPLAHSPGEYGEKDLWRILLLREALTGALASRSLSADATPLQDRSGEFQSALWRLAQSVGRLQALREFTVSRSLQPSAMESAVATWTKQELEQAKRSLAMGIDSVEKRFRPLSRVARYPQGSSDNTPLDELMNASMRRLLLDDVSYSHEHHVFSPRATALRTSFFPFGAPIYSALGAGAPDQQRQLAIELFHNLREKWLRGRGLPPDALHHYTLEDRKVVDNLIQELRNRGVASADEVLLIVEWGSFYATSFEEQFREAIAEESGASESSGPPRRPLTSFYFGGIDGVGADINIKPADPAMRSFPAGRTQGDYLTRLARALERAEKQGRKIKAVGVVGRDVYDKLMVMQAIRPVLNNAIVFTTDADARLGDPSQAAWTRNLLIASSHGLSLPKRILNLAHEHVGEDHAHGHDESGHAGSSPGEFDHLEPAPFRDSYQTSTFIAASAALQAPIRNNEAEWIEASEHRADLLFEVGHHGLFALNQPITLMTSPARTAVFVLAILLSIALLSTGAIPPLRRALDPSRKPGELILHTVNIRLLASATVLIGLLVLDSIARDQLSDPSPEPYSFTSGISSWPRLMWLHIACSFSFFLLLGMIVRQRESVHSEIKLHQHWNTTDPNDTSSMARPKGGQRDSLQLLEQWVDKTRGYKVFLVSGLCALAYTIAFAKLAPTFEYHQFFRNERLAGLSSSLQIASNFLFAWMCFYYLITLFRYLKRMRDFFTASAIFPRRVLKTARREHGYRHASDTAVDQLLDIEIAARSSHVVGNQLLHPFLSLAAVVLGLSSYFDAANFSMSWIVFHAVLVGSLILGATLLRQTLEGLRSTALATCHRMIAQTESAEAAKADTEILNHISGINEGAFAPWHHRPVMKALLYPLGSGGLALLSSGLGG